MSWSKITLIGFEQFLNYENKSLFDGLVLPEGIDLEVLKSTIMLSGGEFEVLYSNPEFMRDQISYWGQRNYRTFEKWIKALNIEYDPLYNYDRHEEWTDEGSGTRENETSLNSSSSTTSDGDGSSSVENTRSAFDSSDYQPHDKTDSEFENHSESSGEDESSGTLKEDTTNKSEHSGHMWGNIGVTTSQQMLQSELDIASWNIYDHISDIFIRDFTVPVYE